MASTSTNSTLFAGLPTIPVLPGTQPERNVFDAFRLAIADQVHRTLPQVELAKIYEGIMVGAKGCDCNIALPRFRLKEDGKVLAKRIADEVCIVSVAAAAVAVGTSSCLVTPC